MCLFLSFCFIFQDFFQAAWAQMSTKNFEKAPVDALKSFAEHNNQGEVSDSWFYVFINLELP